MKTLLVGIAAAGLLLSASAMAQNTTTDTQKSNTPSATTNTQAKPSATSTKTEAKPDANTGRLQNDRTQTNVNVTNGRSRRTTEERHERRGSISTHGRSSVGVNVRERDEYRRRRGIRAEVLVGHRHCRNVIVKKRFHHHVVIRHIRRCL